MAFQFPWTNFHELNLDWFLSKFKQFTDNFLATTATAESVPYGTQPSVTVTGGELDEDTDVTDPFTFNFKIPAGQQGEQGEQGVPGVPGQDGFSPIATVTKSGTVATITITDVNGTTTTTISDGEVTRAEFTALEDAFNDAIIVEQGKNLFNGVTEQGYLSTTGTITPHSNWVSTDFINVTGLTAVISSGKIIATGNRYPMTMFYLCTYDSNKTFIEQLGTVAGGIYTVGANVNYIRFSWHPTDIEDVQTENGTTATGYEPYRVVYQFTDSPYLSDYNVDKFNIYVKADNIYGEFITSSGTISTSPNAARCLVECKYGDVLDICRPQEPYYSAGHGLMLVYDDTMTVIASVDMSQYATISYGQYNAVRYPVTNQNAKYISFNVKLSNYDSTNDTIVSPRNINSVYTGDYISEINNYKLWAVNGADALWKNKKWVVVGDSLTEYNQRTNKHYFDYVADATGINVVNMGDSGSGYASERGIGTAFYQRVVNVPTDADVITIFGSFNDLSEIGTGSGQIPLGDADDTGTTTVGGLINTTFDALFTTYPLANLGVVTPCPWQYANPTNEPNNASAYCDLIVAVCKRRGIPCLDLFHCSSMRPWDADFRTLAYTKDNGNGVHPDETGHKILAPHFEAFLNTLLLK